MAGHPWDPVAPRPRGLVRPVRVDPTGVAGPTRGRAAGPRWRRTSPGFFVPAEVDASLPEQRVLEASVRLPPGAAVTGWAACRLAGAGLVDGVAPDRRTPLPVPLALGACGRIRPDERVLLLYDPLPAGETWVRCGVPATRPVRATFDAMRLAPDEREAAVALDMMAAARLVSIARVAGHLPTRGRVTGIGRVRRGLELAVEGSRSPGETRLRLVWVLDADLPAPHVNCPVHARGGRDDGRLLGIADLLDEEAGLVVEYDGADHRGARRHSRDVEREALLRRHGLEVTRVTGPDLADASAVVDRLLDARRRSRFAAPGQRAWEARPVGPWLDQHLAEQEALAELHAEAMAMPVVDPPRG
ncbi:DUF559 domain-containing protein [Nocardioides donggukensis]|uniref:DUF559 domain-containing protein n=1 Tax=Nocardioides donggukensis TaxID=2774019 RepID=A0A927Q2D5_9ACTN|nr:DUF559 domain-containing protein [Nocardioides donggukensis]MBD8871142.1 DUF559 domain-containing protein [Nocardioides donggukensis]